MKYYNSATDYLYISQNLLSTCANISVNEMAYLLEIIPIQITSWMLMVNLAHVKVQSISSCYF